MRIFKLIATSILMISISQSSFAKVPGKLIQCQDGFFFEVIDQTAILSNVRLSAFDDGSDAQKSFRSADKTTILSAYFMIFMDGGSGSVFYRVNGVQSEHLVCRVTGLQL